MSLAPRAAIARDVLVEAIKNFGMMVRPVRAWRLRRPRTVEVSNRISAQIVEEFGLAPIRMALGQVGAECIRGTTVVEIGPGDNLVLGMAMLALGAREYHAIDRFMGDVEGKHAGRFYSPVAPELPKLLGVRAADIPDPLDFPSAFIGEKVFLYRQGIESYWAMPLAGKADFVFSHGVGQSVVSAKDFAGATAYLLKPGGKAVHLVNFGPVGCWTKYRNPLTFLTIPAGIWKLTSSHRGGANRARFYEFVGHFREAGLDVEAQVLQEFTSEEMEEAKPYLPEPFSAAPKDSMKVRLATFTCTKTAQDRPE